MPRTKKKSPKSPTEVPTVKESREEKLTRLAAKRMHAAVTKIRLIGNLAAYKPTEAQINKLMEHLGESCARVDARLRASAPIEESFTL